MAHLGWYIQSSVWDVKVPDYEDKSGCHYYERVIGAVEKSGGWLVSRQAANMGVHRLPFIRMACVQLLVLQCANWKVARRMRL